MLNAIRSAALASTSDACSHRCSKRFLVTLGVIHNASFRAALPLAFMERLLKRVEFDMPRWDEYTSMWLLREDFGVKLPPSDVEAARGEGCSPGVPHPRRNRSRGIITTVYTPSDPFVRSRQSMQTVKQELRIWLVHGQPKLFPSAVRMQVLDDVEQVSSQTVSFSHEGGAANASAAAARDRRGLSNPLWVKITRFKAFRQGHWIYRFNHSWMGSSMSEASKAMDMGSPCVSVELEFVNATTYFAEPHHDETTAAASTFVHIIQLMEDMRSPMRCEIMDDGCSSDTDTDTDTDTDSKP
jgi:hypothetical protein